MNLTEGQADVLAAVKAGNHTTKEIATASGHEPHSVRSMLLSLNAKNLVKRWRDGNSVEWRAT